MDEKETSLHLFQPPVYRDPSGRWHRSHRDALAACGQSLEIDAAAVLSVICFGWVAGDRTLVRGISRRPWLSSIGSNGEVSLERIPPHGRRAMEARDVARNLGRLLTEEVSRVCENRGEIRVLLSGGLDSRIIAGVLTNAHAAGFLRTRPIAVTWGLADSRDVHYAEIVARECGFEWCHVKLGPEDVYQNVQAVASELGCLQSPEMLHAMLWFRRAPSNAMVLAGSFGDSIGRAEFSGKHLLELRPFRPSNYLGLLSPDLYKEAAHQVQADFDALRSRASDVPDYVSCEHAMQGYRMRGGLCHALTVINHYSRVYQMFTDPAVYSYMWSIHPAARGDEAYAVLLNQLSPTLGQLPWARTNRALLSPTQGGVSQLRLDYHDYSRWSGGPLYDEVCRLVEPEWFHATGWFNARAVGEMNREIRRCRALAGRINNVWLWLAAFRLFVHHLESMGKRVRFQETPRQATSDSCKQSRPKLIHTDVGRELRRLAGRSPIANRLLKGARQNYRSFHRSLLKRQALRKWPVQE